MGNTGAKQQVKDGGVAQRKISKQQQQQRIVTDYWNSQEPMHFTYPQSFMEPQKMTFTNLSRWFHTSPINTQVQYQPVKLSLSFSFLMDIIVRNISMDNVSKSITEYTGDFHIGFKLPHPIFINTNWYDTLVFKFWNLENIENRYKIPDSFLSLSDIIDQEIKTRTPSTWTSKQKEFWTSKWDKIREKYRKFYDNEPMWPSNYQLAYLGSMLFLNSETSMGIQFTRPVQTKTDQQKKRYLDLSLITVLLTYDDILHHYLTRNPIYYIYRTQLPLTPTDNWQKTYTESEFDPTIDMFYRQFVDKLLCDYLCSVIRYLCDNSIIDRPIYILELSSGFGDFMEKFIRKTKHQTCRRKIIYFTVDSSIRGVEQTRKKKRTLQQQKGNVIVEVINLEGDALQQLQKISEEIRFDFIISEGSVLSRSLDIYSKQRDLLDYLVNHRTVKPKIRMREKKTEFDYVSEGGTLKYNPRCFFIHVGLEDFFLYTFTYQSDVDLIPIMLSHNRVWNFLPKIATTLEWSPVYYLV
jgi:hypothetical protein